MAVLCTIEDVDHAFDMADALAEVHWMVDLYATEAGYVIICDDRVVVRRGKLLTRWVASVQLGVTVIK